MGKFNYEREVVFVKLTNGKKTFEVSDDVQIAAFKNSGYSEVEDTPKTTNRKKGDNT